MIGLGYEDQATKVATVTGHNTTCAYFVILSVEENFEVDGLTYTDAEATERAILAIQEDGLCYCDEEH